MLAASLKPPPSLAAFPSTTLTPAPATTSFAPRPHRRSLHLSTAAAASEGATVSQENAASVSAAFDEARLAQFAVDWQSARADKDQGKILTLPVLRSNTGGVILKYSTMQGFVPNPLLSPAHWCKDPKRPIQDVTKDLVGSSISVKVVEANEVEKKLVFSEKDACWSTYSFQVKIGDTYDGIVGSVFHYGAFVHLRFPDGNYHLTGLVHISEVSWDLVQDVQDFLSEGDIVKVIVVNVDAEKSRIGLSIRQLEEDPLLETLDKIIPLEPDLSPDAEITSSPAEIELLPGLEGICNELLQEDGITDVKFGRQALEKRVVQLSYLKKCPLDACRFGTDFFGLPGSHNDIKFLHRSHQFSMIDSVEAPACNFTMNVHAYDIGHYLAGLLYPSWSTFCRLSQIHKTKNPHKDHPCLCDYPKHDHRDYDNVDSHMKFRRNPDKIQIFIEMYEMTEHWKPHTQLRDDLMGHHWKL